MKKWIWGIAVIIVAVLSYFIIPLVDNKPETKPDVEAVVDGVKEGIEIIKSDNANGAKVDGKSGDADSAKDINKETEK